MRSLRAAGAGFVSSLLTRPEAVELALEEEAVLCRGAGMTFLSLPIPDRGTPTPGPMAELVSELIRALERGVNVVVHCRQGIGRSALTVAVVLVAAGLDVDVAFETIAEARGRPVPDTTEQRAWVERHAAGLLAGVSVRVAEQVGRHHRSPRGDTEPDQK